MIANTIELPQKKVANAADFYLTNIENIIFNQYMVNSI
jgi:hypothetical protein